MQSRVRQFCRQILAVNYEQCCIVEIKLDRVENLSLEREALVVRESRVALRKPILLNGVSVDLVDA